MRENTKKTTLLITDDPAVAAAVRCATETIGLEVKHLRTDQDAMSVLLDANAHEHIAIIDLDGRSGRRCLLNTAAGMLPVIAISREPKPWLQSMILRRLISASVLKPISLTSLTGALTTIHEQARGPRPNKASVKRPSSSMDEVFENDFDQSLKFAVCHRPSRQECTGFCRGHCAPRLR